MKYVQPFYDLAGVIHVHTTASDGGADLSAVIQAAEQAGVDLMVMGDHNTVDPRVESLASSVIVIPGFEYTPHYAPVHDAQGVLTGYYSGSNHLLAINLRVAGVIHHDNPQANINDTVAANGLAFLAHPADYWLPWNAWDVTDYTGIEIWTFLSDWAEALQHAPSAMYAYRNPDAVLTGPRDQILLHWDQAGQKRRVVGIGTMDAHSNMQKADGKPIVVFPLGQEMTSLRTHVLLPNPPSADRAQSIHEIVESIRLGRCYIGLDSIADTTGFQFWMQAGQDRYEMGQETTPGAEQRSWTVQVRLPLGAQVTLKRNGKPLHQGFGSYLTLSFEPLPGVYRIEAKLYDRMWIVSNPIYLRRS